MKEKVYLGKVEKGEIKEVRQVEKLSWYYFYLIAMGWQEMTTKKFE